jgi:SNF2 family DNA or RNA helicase
MMLTDTEQLLIDTLKAFPPNSVYADAGKKTIFKGFQLYMNKRVSDIDWKEEDRRALVVGVVDGKHHTIYIFLDGQQLVRTCSCNGHRPEGECEHTICAFLMVIHLLKPHLFKWAKEDVSYRNRLLAGMLKNPAVGGSEEHFTSSVIAPQGLYLNNKGDGHAAVAEKTENDPNFQIIIRKAGSGLKCSLERNGEKIVPSLRGPLLPTGLEHLMSFFRQEDMSTPLSLFLKRWGNTYPMFYHSSKGIHQVKWRNAIPCTTWTEFDTSRKEILLTKGCSVGEDHTTGEIVGDFAFNQRHTTLYYIEDKKGWGLWDKIRQACMREPKIAERIMETKDWSIHIPQEIFKTFQLILSSDTIEGESPLVRFKMNGIEAQPGVMRASDYRLTISRGPKQKSHFLIRPECRNGNLAFSPSKKMTSFAKAVEWGHVPVSVRTQKRKPILLDAYFSALTLKDRKAVDDMLKDKINEDTFGKREFSHLARRTIRSYLNGIKPGDMQLHLIQGEWRLFASNRTKEALLFLILYRVFGTALFERIVLNDAEMVISEEELLKNLASLHTLADREGIDLYLEGRPVERATWEFELDATGGSIDWFEIRPEIRYKGQTIERQLWEKALTGKGVIYRGGSIHILDERTRDTLSIIARITEGSRAANRDIVSVTRLKIIDLFLLRKEGIAVKLSPHDEDVIARLTRFDRIEQKPIPKGLKTELRLYQKEGYYWLSFLYEHRFGACLADDMGLGKTIQAIALLGAIKEGKISGPSSPAAPSLIVVPPSLIFNWEQEIERFYPKLKVHVYRGKDRTIRLTGHDVILTSYGLIRKDIARLREINFHVIVFDEAQTVKNIFAGATAAVRQLKGFFKVVLTGTPVENHIGEYYSILDLVLPGLLGDYREFQGKAKKDLSSFLPVVAEKTKPFVLRRTKERILKELPPKVEHDVYLELTEKQKGFYTRTVEEVRSTIDAAYKQKTASQAKIIALTAIMRLRQICLSPGLLMADIKDISPKIEFLKDKLGELQDESHSALVFSQFTSFLDIVEKELRSGGFRIFRLDGSTPVVKRKDIVEGFQGCADPAVFLLSLKAGGQGLNLTRASYVFHLDPWWNPAVENQASDRSHRIGQKNKVIVTRLLMRHTVEEKMMALKLRKLSLYRALMDTPEKSAGKAITREDFNFLLGIN